MKHPYIEFFDQTRRICTIALNLAEQYKLGGRAALITANFIANKIPILYTHDQELIIRKKVTWRDFHIAFKDPLSGTDDIPHARP